MSACDVPAGAVSNADDCDDGDAGVSPADQEICDSSGTDEDCVGECPHAMAMQQVSLAGDPAGVAVLGRNSTVEALPDMSDGEPAGVRKAIGKVEVELHRDIIRQRRRCTPSRHRRRH